MHVDVAADFLVHIKMDIDWLLKLHHASLASSKKKTLIIFASVILYAKSNTTSHTILGRCFYHGRCYERNNDGPRSKQG